MRKHRNYKSSERGIALVFALLTILVLSILAVAIMTTSQAQNWTASNYRTTAQARYAAEAGIQTTMNYLASAAYPAPNYALYDLSKNPVQVLATHKPVVLSAVTGASTYPDTAVVTAFGAAAQSSLPTVTNASFSTTATLLRMSQSGGASWITGTGGAVQTWQITSVGTVAGLRSSSVQVVETFERTGTPIFNYGLLATGTGCGAITFAGKDSTDSYNSAIGPYNSVTNAGSGGNIYTNGNVTLQGTGANAAKVNGNISAMNNTVGACATSGLTDSSSGNYGSLTGSGIGLSTPLPWGCVTQPCYPPGTLITTNQNTSTSCATIAGCTKSVPPTVTLTDGGSSKTANSVILAPGSYGNLTINAADVVHFTAGSYNINSVTFAQDGQFVIDSGPVVINLVGNCAGGGCHTESGLPSGYSSTEVIYGSGYAGMNACSPSAPGVGVVANPNVYGAVTCGVAKTAFNGIPANMQLVYGGTNTVRLGGMPNAAVVYAPSATYYTPGAPVGLYGSIVCKYFNDQSGSPFHYDTALPSSVTKVGNFTPVGGFSWSKF